MITFVRDDTRFTYRVAGVALHEGRVLLHRGEGEDFWSLPGGRCEMLEPSAQTLRREMREELGADVEVIRLLWVMENFFQYDGFDCHELGLYYLIAFPEGSRVTRQQDDFPGEEEGVSLIFRWHDLATVNDLPLYPSFLRTGLAAIPPALEHVVHVDGSV